MVFNEWNTLVVDDEPDVRDVTRLALRDVKVYGLPVKIHTASSKAEAIELLKSPLVLQGSLEPTLWKKITDGEKKATAVKSTAKRVVAKSAKKKVVRQLVKKVAKEPVKEVAKKTAKKKRQ